MGIYIVYSIIAFSIFIFFLYIYLFSAKLREKYEENKRKKLTEEVEAFIHPILENLEHEFPNDDKIKHLKYIIKDKIKRKIIIEKLVYCTTTFKGVIKEQVIRLCRETHIDSYEIENLKNRKLQTAALACKNLGEFRSVKAIAPLTEAIKNKSIDIKYHALMALGKIGDFESFARSFEEVVNENVLSDRSLIEIADSYEGDRSRLISRMIDSPNLALSTIFIKSSCNYMSASLNERISKYITDSSKERRIAAIKAIGQNADTRFLMDIVNCLKDEVWEVRAAAAKSLGRIGDGRALKSLRAALADNQWWVRYNSAQAIIKIPGGVEIIDDVLRGEDKFAKDIIISALENSGIQNTSDYTEGLQYKNKT